MSLTGVADAVLGLDGKRGKETSTRFPTYPFFLGLYIVTDSALLKERIWQLAYLS